MESGSGSNIAQTVLPRPANRLVSQVYAVRLVRTNGLHSRKICWKGLTEISASKRHATAVTQHVRCTCDDGIAMTLR